MKYTHFPKISDQPPKIEENLYVWSMRKHFPVVFLKWCNCFVRMILPITFYKNATNIKNLFPTTTFLPLFQWDLQKYWVELQVNLLCVLRLTSESTNLLVIPKMKSLINVYQYLLLHCWELIYPAINENSSNFFKVKCFLI